MLHHARTPEDMLALGKDCGSMARAGGIWILSGSLGAGKTHWTKGFVAGVGSPADVTSPTFGLVHEYRGGKAPVFHFDFYRLKDADELYALGWDEYLEQGGIVVAEWGERFPDAFPSAVTRVDITAGADGSRQVRISH